MTDTMSKIFKYNCKRFFVHCMVDINNILCCAGFSLHSVEMRTDAQMYGHVYSLFVCLLRLLLLLQFHFAVYPWHKCPHRKLLLRDLCLMNSRSFRSGKKKFRHSDILSVRLINDCVKSFDQMLETK